MRIEFLSCVQRLPRDEVHYELFYNFLKVTGTRECFILSKCVFFLFFLNGNACVSVSR